MALDPMSVARPPANIVVADFEPRTPSWLRVAFSVQLRSLRDFSPFLGKMEQPLQSATQWRNVTGA